MTDHGERRAVTNRSEAEALSGKESKMCNNFPLFCACETISPRIYRFSPLQHPMAIPRKIMNSSPAWGKTRRLSVRVNIDNFPFEGDVLEANTREDESGWGTIFLFPILLVEALYP